MISIANLAQLIKKAAIEAVEASKPCNIVFAKVVSVSPISVNIDQKLTLTSEFLCMSKNVTNYEVEVDITSWRTETTNDHNHEMKGNKLKMKVLNALNEGDNVVMIRMQGGQKYLIIDKVV